MSNPVITKFFNYQHFVPYWGFFIPNNKTSSAADTFFLVSIPTRGLLIPNDYEKVVIEAHTKKFPSPQGVS